MKKILLFLFLSIQSLGGFAQFTPTALLSFKYEYPNIRTNYNRVDLKVPNPFGGGAFFDIKSVHVTRDVNGNVTNTNETMNPALPFPLDIYRGTATVSSNIYTVWTELAPGGDTSNWRNFNRDTIYRNGSLDTSLVSYNWDTLTQTYKKTQRLQVQFNGNGFMSSTNQYNYDTTASGWVLTETRQITYSGNNRVTDSTYGDYNGIWQLIGYVQYFYSGSKLDSVLGYSRMSDSTIELSNISSFEYDSTGKANQFISWAYDSTDGWAVQTVVGFSNATNVGIADVKESDHILVYPVPAKDQLFVRVTENNATISLFSMDGKEVYSASADAGLHSIDCSLFKKGIYLVKIKTNNATRLKKIVLD